MQNANGGTRWQMSHYQSGGGELWTESIYDIRYRGTFQGVYQPTVPGMSEKPIEIELLDIVFDIFSESEEDLYNVFFEKIYNISFGAVIKAENFNDLQNRKTEYTRYYINYPERTSVTINDIPITSKLWLIKIKRTETGLETEKVGEAFLTVDRNKNQIRINNFIIEDPDNPTNAIVEIKGGNYYSNADLEFYFIINETPTFEGQGADYPKRKCKVKVKYKYSHYFNLP